jgi:DNA-binding NarL/FixJ family response regulator
MTTRVLIADDHILFAQTLAGLLSKRFEIVEIVGDGRALLNAARKHKPDVVVADITMPHMSGLDSVRSLRKDSYQPKIVFLTMHADTELARECFRSGASGFVTKDQGFDELTIAIDSAIAGRRYISPNIASELMDVLRDSNVVHPVAESLTSRQRQILQLLAEGKTMKEIAALTNLSTRTVEWHKYRMMQMLHIERSAELVQHAVRMKLVI